MANGLGSIVLGTWDYWYVSTNTDNSYKIYNAYNNEALDTASGGITPVVLPVSNLNTQGWLINQNSDSTLSIFNHYYNKYHGLVDGGRPAYLDAAAASYTRWSFIPAITTSTVTATSTQITTSTVGASTSTVTGPSITGTITVFATTTRILTVVAPTPAAVKLAKRWVGSTSISTTTVTTTSLAYVNGPLVFVTIPGGRLETTVTSELTVTSTSTSALQPGSGGGSSSLSGPIGSQTSSTSSTLSQGTKSGALKLGFSLLNFLMGTGFLLFVNVL